MASPNVSLNNSQGLDAVTQLLGQFPADLVAKNDPLVNEQLQFLVNSLHHAQKKAGMLSSPDISLASTYSTADLVGILMHEVRKTNNLSATSTLLQVQNQQKEVIATNNNTLKKLQESGDAAKKAAKLQEGLGIFKWVMLAVSILLTVLSTVATVLTAGASAGLVGASVALMAASLALIVITSVPVDGKGNSAMNMLSDTISKAIAQTAKQNTIDDLKAAGIDWESLSDTQQANYLEQAKEDGTYGAMGVMIGIQIVIAIAMIVATAGFGFAAATSTAVQGTARATQTAALAAQEGAQVGASAAKDATQSTISTIRAALTVAKDTIAQNREALLNVAQQATKAGQLVQGIGTMTSSGMQIGAALHKKEAAQANAQVIYNRAFARFLGTNNDNLIAVVKELYQDIASSYDAAHSILVANHQTNINQSSILAS